MNLEDSLRSSKPTVEPPPFLHSRIMNAVRSEGAPAYAQSGAWGSVRLVCGTLALVGLVLVFIFSSGSPQPEQVAVAPVIAVPVMPAISLPETASLQTEIENLKADTRNAARALAANFLPSQL